MRQCNSVCSTSSASPANLQMNNGDLSQETSLAASLHALTPAPPRVQTGLSGAVINPLDTLRLQPTTPNLLPLPELYVVVVKCVCESSSEGRKSGYESKSAVFLSFLSLSPLPPLPPNVLRGSGPGDPSRLGRRKPPDEFDYVGAS